MGPSEEVVYLLARLGLHVADDPLAVIREWGEHFARARQQGEYETCRYLLHAAKGWPLPDHSRALVLYSEGWLLDRLGYPGEAIKVYQRSSRLFDAAGLPQLGSVLLAQIGSLYQDQRDYDAAGSAYAEALDAATAGGDEHQRARVLHNVGTLALARGAPGDAEAPLQEAADVFGRRGDTYNAAAAKLALGYVRESLGRPAEAQRLFLAALQDFQEAGDQHGAANAIASLGVLEIAHGDDANAAQLLEQALAVLTALEDHPSVARTMNNLAIVEVRRGQAQEAIAHWTRCRDLYLEMGDSESADDISRRLEEFQSRAGG